MSNQQFEKLLKLDDEELNTGDTDNSHDNNRTESCKVPMLHDGDNKGRFADLDDNLSAMKHSRSKQVSSGISFVINGRHIQLNSQQLKYISLVTLTVQNAALSLTMRAARTQKDQFSLPVAVTLAEVLKLLTCIALIWYEEHFSIRSTFRSIKSHVIDNHIDTLKVAVPSFVYYVQNNLCYVGSTHLDAATYSVIYQLKILTTAIFSVTMLNKKLSKVQWASLLTLFIGVALIEMLVVSSHKVENPNSLLTDEHPPTPSLDVNPHFEQEKPIVGFIAVLLACCMSGFAGVYFEKILKNTSHISLWIRNIQLSLVAIPIGAIQVLFSEHDFLMEKGLLYGFTPLTWLCIVLQVQGGLLVAVVVKFANNILKGFATSLSIVIATVASIFLFNFQLTPNFFFGASLVISSVLMYNKF